MMKNTESQTDEINRQQNENYFRTIAASAPMLIWLSGTDKLRCFFNQGWLDFTGRSLSQEIGNGWIEGVHPEDYERCMETYVAHFDARTPFYMEYRLKNHNGKYRWISDRGVPRYDDAGVFTGYIGACLDIDDDRNFAIKLEKEVTRRTKELEQSRAFLTSVLNSTYYGIASYEPIHDQNNTIVDFRISYSNKEVPANFGLKVEDVIGKTCKEVYPGIFENGVFEKLVDCINDGKPYSYEIDVNQEGKLVWLGAAIEKVENSVTVTSKNITKEKEAALHLEEMNILLNSKNTELASFTYIASHDLQEPLRKIQMFASRILETDTENFSEKSMSYFKSITATANRMQQLIDALLSYSEMDSENLRPIKTNLNKLVKEVLGLLDTSLNGQEALIELGELPTVRVIPIQFQQLFLNIIGNAIKYSKPNEPPVVKLEATKKMIDNQYYWKISVSDQGIGFDPKYSEKIFEVFQRLHGKKEYVGTGVGLAICQKIIKNHNGFITAESTPNVGATFSIFLPTAN